MQRIWPRAVLLWVCIGALFSFPSLTDACSCYADPHRVTGYFYPGSGAIPLNSRGILWHKPPNMAFSHTARHFVAKPEMFQVEQKVGGDFVPVPFRIHKLKLALAFQTNFFLIAPKQAFQAGQIYRFTTQPEAFGKEWSHILQGRMSPDQEDAARNEAVVTVSSSRIPPTKVKTTLEVRKWHRFNPRKPGKRAFLLRVGGSYGITLSSGGGPCAYGIDAAWQMFRLLLPDGWRDWKENFLYFVKVNGRDYTSPVSSACSRRRLGRSGEFTGTERLVLGCGKDKKALFWGGITATRKSASGKYRVKMSAILPGTSTFVEAEREVLFSCSPPPKNEGGVKLAQKKTPPTRELYVIGPLAWWGMGALALGFLSLSWLAWKRTKS